jgi:DNA-binding transcriptional LysR family regulator
VLKSISRWCSRWHRIEKAAEVALRLVAKRQAPQLTSTLNLVAAGLGVSVVPESLKHLRLNDIAYLHMRGDAPRAALGLASHVDERSAAVGNFVALALGIAQGRHDTEIR